LPRFVYNEAMIINIAAKNFELTPAIRKYIEDKIADLNKFVGPNLDVDSVEINFEVSKTTQHHRKGDVFYAEANLNILGNLLRAERNADTLYKAIDEVKDLLADEVREFKDRERERRKLGV